MRYKVNFGYDSLLRPKNKYYPSVEAATKAASDHFNRTKIVLSIVVAPKK